MSKSSHEEAIGVFQSASEPILVQMLRRAPVKPSPSELSSVKVRLMTITIIFLVHHVCESVKLFEVGR